jgi:selenocysteine lyase/cysteine desulfurase
VEGGLRVGYAHYPTVDEVDRFFGALAVLAAR